ncbi:MAG TPA: outer membrane beta-barrel protein [Fibrobacteraceae bacterium]|nr:outer membrane beta-barrel protein [Fibrobacteraceae bacterium]
MQRVLLILVTFLSVSIPASTISIGQSLDVNLTKGFYPSSYKGAQELLDEGIMKMYWRHGYGAGLWEQYRLDNGLSAEINLSWNKLMVKESFNESDLYINRYALHSLDAFLSAGYVLQPAPNLQLLAFAGLGYVHGWDEYMELSFYDIEDSLGNGKVAQYWYDFDYHYDAVTVKGQIGVDYQNMGIRFSYVRELNRLHEENFQNLPWIHRFELAITARLFQWKSAGQKGT